MTETGTPIDDLLWRAKAGNTAALGALFAHYRDRRREAHYCRAGSIRALALPKPTR
jgi:hypothetical protein